ncbi:hypothetical protein AVEN_51954-1 [Araneus ventricosus]|uniref:Transposable element Tc1 transposase n=1 Tax=Araneus ventricosus TaxID=182803 RepID=A0A4Y2NRQ1_ARAVE|nr:hypothetical protein AVEN_51954-1 [Araneus ventricosus]
MMGHLQVSVCELFNGPSLIGPLSRRPTRAPLLIVLHKVLLLSWARQHYHWTVDDWKHVTWSDESRFQLYRTDARVRVWRHVSLIHRPCLSTGTVQSGGASVMVWEVCSWRDMGPLISLETTLTGDRRFHWPPKSPEMNIIEDIRDALLHAVEKRSSPPRTPMDLLTALQDSWCEFPPGYLQTLAESMPRRFASLLRARVGLTRY